MTDARKPEPLDLDAIEARANAVYQYDATKGLYVYRDLGAVVADESPEYLEFDAHVIEDHFALIAELRETRAQVQRVEELAAWLDRYDGAIGDKYAAKVHAALAPETKPQPTCRHGMTEPHTYYSESAAWSSGESRCNGLPEAAR